MEFEGAPVYRLYHFGGLTSFVQPRLLDKIDLYPGNFSARFGRKMGLFETAPRRLPHGGESFLHAKSDVRRTRLGFRQHCARRIV